MKLMRLLLDRKKAPNKRGTSAMLRRLATRSAKPPCSRSRVTALAFMGFLTAAGGTQAAVTYTKANNNTALNAAGSYTANSGTPTNADTVLFDSNVPGPLTFSSGSGLFIGTLQIANPGGAQTLTINSGGSATTLTIGATTANTAIDMSAATQDFSILNSGALVSTLRLATLTGTHTFNVATGRTLTIGTNLTTQGGTQTLALTGGGNVILNGIVSGAAALSLNITGVNVTLGNANTYTGTTTLSSGTLALGNATALSTGTLTDNSTTNALTFASGIGNFTVQGLAGTGGFALSDAASNAVTLTVGNNNASTAYSGVLTGAGSLVKFGSGTLTLSGANTYSGTTTIGGGTLLLTNSNANTSAVVNNFGTLSLGTGGSLGGTITLNNGSVLNMAAVGTNFPGNAITLGTGAIASLTSANLSNAITGTVSSTGTDATSDLKIGSNVSFNGGGTQQFANFYGTAEIVNAGSLRFSSTTPSGNGGANTTFLIDSGGTLFTRNAGNILLGALSGAGTLTGAATTGGANTFTIGGNNASTTFSGLISNGGAAGDVTTITKVGTGTLTLTGANTYTGATNVSGGELRLDNPSAVGTGGVNETSGILSGTGAAAGLVTVSGGALAAGDNTAGTGFGTAGTLGVGTTGGAMLTNATLDFDLSSAFNGTNDLLTTGGTLGLGTLSFAFNELSGMLDTTNPYMLISGAAGVTGFTGGYATTFLGGTGPAYTATYSVDDSNNLVVSFSSPVAAPEPSQTVALLIGFLGIGGLVVRARRRMQTA